MVVVKDLEVDKEILKRIEMICRFAYVKPIIKNEKNLKFLCLYYIIYNINITWHSIKKFAKIY